MKNTKRVLLFCQHFYPEMISTGMHMTELFLALQEIGWSVYVCTAQPSLILEKNGIRVSRRMSYQGIDIVRVRSLGSHSGSLLNRALFASSYFFMSFIYLITQVRKMDGIVFTTNPPFLGLLGVIAKVLFRKKYLYIVYDIYPDIAVNMGVIKKNGILHRIWERLARLMLDQADRNVVIGRDMREIIMAKTRINRHERIVLIPNWSDDRIVYPIMDIDNELKRKWAEGFELVIQYSGRMARTHNLEPLIEAAEILKAHPFLFQFIGDGAKKKMLQGMVNQKKLENVRFYSYQPLKKLSETLSVADIAVVCLEKEYVGLSVPSKTYGIMAVARPILGILKIESEIGRMINESECGVVLPEPTGESVALILLNMAGDRKRLKKMGERGYQEFLRNYTLKIAADRYNRIMEEIFIRE